MDESIREEKMRLLQAGIEKVRQEFIASLPGRVEELDGLLDQLYDAPERAHAAIAEISRSVHKLHGQAGSFGFAEMGVQAGKVERAAMDTLETPGGLDAEQVELHLVDLIDMISESLEAA